jgi:hypothetical protein
MRKLDWAILGDPKEWHGFTEDMISVARIEERTVYYSPSFVPFRGIGITEVQGNDCDTLDEAIEWVEAGL